MQSTMYALVDCNNFFVSCERVFNPKLHNRPVVVLSNNDGCIISRSNEAKRLGIAMGAPFFKIQDVLQKNKVAVLSSNFALYGDLSARVMSIIESSFQEVMIYSVDEAFIDLSAMQQNFDLYKLCINLVQKIEQYTGIPVSIGIAPTKTLAKVANHVAKKHAIPTRVFRLDAKPKITEILTNFAITDIWGIGWRLGKKLNAMGVYTAVKLLDLPPNVIQKNFTIVMRRTILELQGISCIELKDVNINKQQIMVSRSFGHRITELNLLQEAIATYASTACCKMRKQGSITNGIYVFINTALHGAPENTYRNSLYIPLPHPSSDTREIIYWAKYGLAQLFRAGFKYKKVGIILCDLYPVTNMQIDLFGHTNLVKSQELMSLIDSINQKFGRATIQLAAAGLQKTWREVAAKKSDNFTVRWQDLPRVSLQ